MRLHITLLLCASLLSNAEAADITWQKLTVNIDNIDAARGGVVALYLFLEEGFPTKHDMALKSYQFEATSTSHQLVIKVPVQPFALKAHHDDDRSGNVTKNWTDFIPAEGLAFSSGARLSFGPPSFKDAMMTVPSNQKTHLPMIYP